MVNMLPYQGGFHGLHTTSNHYNHDDDDEEDDAVYDNVEDDDSMASLMMMMEDAEATNNGDSNTTSSSSSVSKSYWKRLKHAKSEQKRRQRINSHHATLRHLFPNLLKKDKASLLRETVRRVKELTKIVDDIGGAGDGADKGWFRSLPCEKDEATVSYCESGSNGEKRVTIAVCCEDSPSLNWELMNAIRSVKGRAVRAELSTIGGRTKAVVVVEWRESGGGEEDVCSLRRALRTMVENRPFDSESVNRPYNKKWAGLAHEFLNSKRAPVVDPIQDVLTEGLIPRSSI